MMPVENPWIAGLFCLGVFVALMGFAWVIRPRYEGEK